jgi:hypothetical protein
MRQQVGFEPAMRGDFSTMKNMKEIQFLKEFFQE